MIYIGHYKIPAEYRPQNQPLQITGRSDPVILQASTLNVTGAKLSIVQTEMSNNTLQSENNRNWKKVISKTYSASKVWINQQENKGLKFALIVLIGCIIAMFWYLNAQFKEFQQLSQV